MVKREVLEFLGFFHREKSLNPLPNRSFLDLMFNSEIFKKLISVFEKQKK